MSISFLYEKCVIEYRSVSCIARYEIIPNSKLLGSDLSRHPSTLFESTSIACNCDISFHFDSNWMI